MNIHFPKQVKRLTAFSLTVAAVAFLWLALSVAGDTPTALAQAGDTPTPEATTESGDDFGDQQFRSPLRASSSLHNTLRHSPEHRVEVEALVDAQAGLAQ